jgi:hypothetical protein
MLLAAEQLFCVSGYSSRGAVCALHDQALRRLRLAAPAASPCDLDQPLQPSPR